MSRKQAREAAFRIIFASLIDMKTEDGATTIFKPDYTFDDAITGGFSLDTESKQYIQSVIEAVEKNYETLSQLIKKHSKNNLTYSVDFSILLLATTEILFLKDIPHNVSANEAVDLAKKFSTDKSPAFINGVLSGVIREQGGN